MPATPSPPLVDIVLPTYGPVPYLHESLASAFAQTYPHWRLTLIDNSPETGGARSVLRAFEGDPRVRYVATGGLSQADNWSAAFASGDAPYIGMLHDDDLWDPDFVERRVAALEAHPECGFAFGSSREIDGQGQLVAIHARRVRAGVLQPEEFVPREFLRNAIPTNTVLYRRSAYEAVGGRFDPDSGYIDYDLFMRLAIRYPVVSLDVHDCSLRLHEGSVTTSFQQSQHNGELWLRFVDHAEAAVDRERADLLPPALRRRRRAQALTSMAGDELINGDREASIRRLLEALRLYPRAVLNPQVLLLVLMLPAGSRASGYMAKARELKIRWKVPSNRVELKRRLDDLRATTRERARA